MTFSEARRPAALIALLIAVGGGSATRAADDDTPVSVLIGDAVAEYDAGHFQEARALFRQAHEKPPTARTLRGIGMCSFELRDYVEATRALGASLRETRRPLTAEQKRHAEALLSAREHVRRPVHREDQTGQRRRCSSTDIPPSWSPTACCCCRSGSTAVAARARPVRRPRRTRTSMFRAASTRTVELALAPAPPRSNCRRCRARARRRRRVGRNGCLAASGAHDATVEQSHAHALVRRRRGRRRAGRGRQRAVVARPAAPAGHLPQQRDRDGRSAATESDISTRRKRRHRARPSAWARPR